MRQALLPDVDPALYEVRGEYGAGDHFGAESCILQVPSKEAVVAHTFCKCVRLLGADLDDILRCFPEYTGRCTGACGLLMISDIFLA